VLAIALLPALAGCDLMTAVATPSSSRLSATLAPPPTGLPVESDEVPTLRPGPSGGGPDLQDAADGLADLRSYRLSVLSQGLVPSSGSDGRVTMTATLVQGDEPAVAFAMVGIAGVDGVRLDAIIIGDQAWLKNAAGHWVSSPGGAGDVEAPLTALSPPDLVSDFDALSASLRQIGPERRNGQSTVHWQTSAGDAAAASAGLSAGTVDAWLAAVGGDLVALNITGTWDIDGTPTPIVLRIDISRVNDPANRITPPG
jgi:hypothetical protein